MKFRFYPYFLSVIFITGMLCGCANTAKQVSVKGADVPTRLEVDTPPPIEGQGEGKEEKKEKVDIPMDASAYHHFLLAQSFLGKDTPEKASQAYQEALKH